MRSLRDGWTSMASGSIVFKCDDVTSLGLITLEYERAAFAERGGTVQENEIWRPGVRGIVRLTVCHVQCKIRADPTQSNGKSRSSNHESSEVAGVPT